MRELTERKVTAFARNDNNSIQGISMTRSQYSSISKDLILPQCTLIDLSNNGFSIVNDIWSRFPNAWWVSFASNCITNIQPWLLLIPQSLSLLDLRDNLICTKQDLAILSKSYILQLNIFDTKVYNDMILSYGYHDNNNNNDIKMKAIFQTRLELIKLLPNIWILNEDFVSYNERKYIKDKNDNNDNINNMDIHFSQKLSDRQLNMLRAIQNIPQSGQLSDSMKLEIILEDYLEYARIFNKYCYPNLKVNKKPIINFFGIMSMPHKTRLDFSVLLTISIAYKIPQEIYLDALIILLNKYLTVSEIKDVAVIPCYLRTAVVMICRKICYRELIEISHFNGLSEKPKMSDFLSFVFTTDSLEHPDCPLPTYELDGGFQHLGPVKHYLHRPLHRDSLFGPSKKPDSYVPYSDLELELLEYLPDAPTKNTFFDVKKYGGENFLQELVSKPIDASASLAKNKKEYKLDDWLGLAARHAVILLSKSAVCPSLTKNQNTKKSQKLYEEMLPLLNCASLSYVDLGLQKTGPILDGRISNPNPKSDIAKIQIGGKVLGFGLGLPHNTPASLAWNSTEHKVDRKALWDIDDNSSAGSSSLHDNVNGVVPSPAPNQRRPYSPSKVSIDLNGANFESSQRNEVSQYSSELHVSHDSISHYDVHQSMSLTSIREGGLLSPVNKRKNSNPSLLKKVKSNSTLQLKPVSGFTSDENWAPVFVLSSTTNTVGNAKFRCWDELSKPPVLVNPSVDVDNSNNKFFLTINSKRDSPPMSTSIQMDSEGNREEGEGEGASLKERSLNDSLQDTASMGNDAESSFIFVDGHDAEGDDINVVSGMKTPINNLNPYPTIIDKFNSKDISTEEAKLRLLAEMGTLKNLRQASLKQAGKKYKPVTAVKVSVPSAVGEGGTFLTSNRDDEGGGEGGEELSHKSGSRLSFNEEDQAQNDVQFQAYVDSISKILDNSDRRGMGMQMDRCYSYSDLLKLRFNYDNIVTSTSGVERGSNRTFYPVYSKFVYLLDKNALKHSFSASSGASNNTSTRASSPMAAQTNAHGNEGHVNINVHLNNVQFSSPGGDSSVFSPTSNASKQTSRQNSPTTQTVKSHASQHESFLLGSLVGGGGGGEGGGGTVADYYSVKPSNTFLEDSFNLDGGSSTYLNKLVKKLTSEQSMIKGADPPNIAYDDRPKRGIKYFEPSKNEVYQLDPYLVDTSMSKGVDKAKSKVSKASTSMSMSGGGVGIDQTPPISKGLRTNTLIHKSSTAKLRLSASFRVNNPDCRVNPNLRLSFGELPPLVSKKMKVNA